MPRLKVTSFYLLEWSGCVYQWQLLKLLFANTRLLWLYCCHFPRPLMDLRRTLLFSFHFLVATFSSITIQFNWKSLSYSWFNSKSPFLPGSLCFTASFVNGRSFTARQLGSKKPRERNQLAGPGQWPIRAKPDVERFLGSDVLFSPPKLFTVVKGSYLGVGGGGGVHIDDRRI